MTQVYVIYLRSNPMVHDVLATSAAAAIDFKQFFNPRQDSYAERRKRTRPDLYRDMNAVDFLVLESCPDWSRADGAAAAKSWSNRPNEVLAAIRSATASNAVIGPVTAQPAAPTSSPAKSPRTVLFTQNLRPSEVNDRDVEVEIRWAELIHRECRQVQSVYPPDVLHDFEDRTGSYDRLVYLTEDELKEQLEIYEYVWTRLGMEPNRHRVSQINRLLGVWHFSRALQEAPNQERVAENQAPPDRFTDSSSGQSERSKQQASESPSPTSASNEDALVPEMLKRRTES